MREEGSGRAGAGRERVWEAPTARLAGTAPYPIPGWPPRGRRGREEETAPGGDLLGAHLDSWRPGRDGGVALGGRERPRKGASLSGCPGATGTASRR